jgi:hypothetical protein
MQCDEAINASPSRTCGVEVPRGRVLISGRADGVVLTLVPRLVDSGVLNEAGTVVHNELFKDVSRAMAVAHNDYGVTHEASWQPVEQLSGSRVVTHAPQVEGHHIVPHHNQNDV